MPHISSQYNSGIVVSPAVVTEILRKAGGTGQGVGEQVGGGGSTSPQHSILRHQVSLREKAVDPEGTKFQMWMGEGKEECWKVCVRR